MGLIRILAIFLFIVMAFRLLARFVFPWMLRSFISKKQRDFEQQMKDFQQKQAPLKKEGEVNIDYVPKKDGKKKGKGDDGEYVDYEEVD